MSAPLVARQVLVRGRVQGVYFRQAARRRADELGLRGWVRNRRDGGVEVAIQGPPKAVAALIEWCQLGPPGAGVEALDVREATVDPNLFEFEIRPTV